MLRTFNLPALCEELIVAYKQCELGALHWKSLTPLKEEIEWHLKHDGIARRVLGAGLEAVEKRILEWAGEAGGPDISHACSFIVTELKERYFAELRAEIVRLVALPNEKKKIRHVASSLLTEMVRRGFAAPFINHRLIVFFFKDRQIVSATDISLFLQRFEEGEKTFTVLAQAPTRGELLAVGTNPDFIAFKQDVTGFIPEGAVIDAFLRDAGSVNGFLIFKNVQAMDPYSARRAATERLEMVSSVLRFYRHQLNEDLCTDAKWLVVEHDAAPGGVQAYPIPAPRNISFRRPDVSDDKLEESLREILRPFISGNCDQGARDQLEAALNAHAAAVKSNLADNRFMNFLACFRDYGWKHR